MKSVILSSFINLEFSYSEYRYSFYCVGIKLVDSFLVYYNTYLLMFLKY